MTGRLDLDSMMLARYEVQSKQTLPLASGDSNTPYKMWVERYPDSAFPDSGIIQVRWATDKPTAMRIYWGLVQTPEYQQHRDTITLYERTDNGWTAIEQVGAAPQTYIPPEYKKSTTTVTPPSTTKKFPTGLVVGIGIAAIGLGYLLMRRKK